METTFQENGVSWFLFTKREFHSMFYIQPMGGASLIPRKKCLIHGGPGRSRGYRLDNTTYEWHLMAVESGDLVGEVIKPENRWTLEN